ncbi:hypothetical protein BGX21_006699, partial [Mortierella sp. AD011]
DAQEYLVYVGPLSQDIFEKLFDAVCVPIDPTARSRLEQIKDYVVQITNCVPRELINLAKNIGFDPLTPEQVDGILKAYEARSLGAYRTETTSYYYKLDADQRNETMQALTKMFLPRNASQQTGRTGIFDWKFLDSGLVYQSTSEYGEPLYHPITPAAKKALLDLYQICPLPKALRNGLVSNNLN